MDMKIGIKGKWNVIFIIIILLKWLEEKEGILKWLELEYEKTQRKCEGSNWNCLRYKKSAKTDIQVRYLNKFSTI